MKRLQKFLKLSWRDQLLLIQATIVLAAVVVGLRVFPWRTLQGWLVRQGPRPARLEARRRPSVQQIARAVRLASFGIPGATCLPQAIAAQFLLIQRAYSADLQIGVTKNEHGKLEAHAWITGEDGIIIGNVPNLDHFRMLSPVER